MSLAGPQVADRKMKIYISAEMEDVTGDVTGEQLSLQVLNYAVSVRRICLPNALISNFRDSFSSMVEIANSTLRSNSFTSDQLGPKSIAREMEPGWNKDSSV